MTTVVILAAGKGTRMKSAQPKVLHRACGRSLLGWALAAAREAGADRIVLVLGEQRERVLADLLEQGELEAPGRLAGGVPIEVVVQEPQLGTGHALMVAAPALAAERGSIVVTYGDMPVLTGATLRGLLARQPAGGAAVLAAEVPQPRGYGRLLETDQGGLTGIVEEKDATPAQRRIRRVNVGVYAFPSDLPGFIAKLDNKNAQGEYYLTDAIGLLLAAGRAVQTVDLEEPREARGVNTLAELAEARRSLQMRILEGHLLAGVQIEDPDSTWIDVGVAIGTGTVILPATVIRRGVVIGSHCEVGPFTHLREGTVLADHAAVGNFTETKQASLGAHTKAKHLSYLGDVTIGPGANIGAGTIVANYDGVNKHRTDIGAGAFIGSGSILVAPSSVGEGALTGAGAVLTRKQVPPGEAWVGVPARSLGPRPAKTVKAKARPEPKG
jgi:bifunctional UDP-N-acetylglucosamine pyrophosphorylase/glucosamine-1-phosphate N-acetyltransferase